MKALVDRKKVFSQGRNSKIALIFGGVFAIIGVLVLAISFAATPLDTIVFEAEDSSLSPSIVTVNDSGASGGQYVEFRQGSVSNPSIPTVVKWHDNIQTESNWTNWGPGFYPVCGISSGQPSNCFNTSFNEGSLARTPDPAGGGGFAIRHQIPSNGGRAQYSMANWTNPAFGAATANNEIWIEWEVYFPQVPTYVGSTSWLSIMDFHSHGSSGEEWWATDGAVMFASQALGGTSSDQGKLRMRDYTNTRFSNISAQPLPANRWVKLLVHYNWSTSEVPITVYVDGVQAMQLTAITKRPIHSQLEFMVKLYGGGTWNPNPITYYSKNVKILGFE